MTVSAAYGQSPENVAVVVNDNSPDSQRIAEYYARNRRRWKLFALIATHEVEPNCGHS